MYTQWFSWEIETFETVLSTVITERGKGIITSQFPHLGKSKHNCVWRAYQWGVYTHIYSYINTHANNTYTHTLALTTVSHYITIYFPSWKQSFSHFIQATGDCLLPNLSGISKMALTLSHFYFWWLLFKFSGPYPVNSFT